MKNIIVIFSMLLLCSCDYLLEEIVFPRLDIKHTGEPLLTRLRDEGKLADHVVCSNVYVSPAERFQDYTITVKLTNFGFSDWTNIMTKDTEYYGSVNRIREALSDWVVTNCTIQKSDIAYISSENYPAEIYWVRTGSNTAYLIMNYF